MKRAEIRRGTTRLKRSGRLRPVSAKTRRAKPGFEAVYREVDARSGGRCEVILVARGTISGHRCCMRAKDHHHLFKPRAVHTTVGEVVGICRPHHERVDWPYAKGRLVFVGSIGGDPSPYPERYFFAIRYAASKFEARQLGS